MATLLRSKKKGKKNKPAPLSEPARRDVELMTVDSEGKVESSGSQVSVREADRENVTDNTTNENNSNSEEKGSKGAKGNKKTKAEKKGGNLGLAKPAWRGASLEKGNKSSEKTRTSTPVEALEKEDNSVSASTASIQSSAKEAWSDDGKAGPKSQKGKQTGSVVSLTKAAKNERNSQDGDSASLLSEKSIVRRGDNQSEQHAYVPYLYARDCVARITSDMTQMKDNHVKIVREIETNYHLIEDQTQSQFNTFILLLRTEYSGKVKTFRQVIEAHRAELEHKQGYWDDMLKSLTQRNNQLLNDKKSLLIKNKIEMERLENEKNEAVNQLSQKLESAQATVVTVEKERSLELEQTRQALGTDHMAVVSRLQEENKVLAVQLESEKAEIENLQKRLKERPVPVLTSVDEGDSSSPQGGETARVAIVTGHDRLKQERQFIETEREKMATEREALQQSQDQLRRDLDSVQDDLNDSRKAAAEWKTKYSVIQPQLQDYGRLSAAYSALKEQYSVLAAVTAATAASSTDSKQAAQDSLKTMETEVVMMSEARDSTQKDIDKWEKEFEKKNGRAPTEDDKSDSVKEMYTSLGEVDLMLGSLERKKETLQKLQSGEVPEVKSIPQATVQVAEPIIKTVEVEVPDPKTVQELEASVALVAKLRAEISQITADNAKLQGEATDLEVALSDSQEEITALKAGGFVTADSADTQEYEDKITKLEGELLNATDEMMREKTAHDLTRDELEVMAAQLRVTTDELQTKTLGLNSEIETAKTTAKAEIKAKDNELASMTARLSELENERLSNLPPDTAKEIKQLRARITHLEKERNSSITTAETAEAKMMEMSTKLGAVTATLETQRSANREAEIKLKKLQSEKEKSVRELTSQVQKKEQQRLAAEKNLAALEKKMKSAGVEREGTTAGPKGGVAVVAGASDSGLKRENVELKRRVKDLEAEVKRAGKAAGAAGSAGETAAADRQAMKKNEKVLKELEKKLDMEIRKREKHEQNLKIKEEELNNLQKENDKNKRELVSAQGELSVLGVSAKEGLAAAEKVKALEADVKRLTDENKTLTENFNSERVLRKKYYNMVEDMKGKIRVYCRSRPLSKTEKGNGNYEVVKSPDEFSVQVESSRGLKEFQFDQVFTGECSQEKIFEDTHNLIQSAVDGYNVCIFAYGQTGSGKTFTMIGDRDQNFPGVAPRAFDRIFEVIEENKTKYSFKVSSYMLELYNDHLIDLYGKTSEDKLDVRKDQQGMVFVSGAAVKKAVNSKELFALFEEGSKNRHVASTKMNAESSRSHLIIAVVIESTNLATGQVTRGKLSLVDLAGSERVGKTEATAEQLKEAMSINKSLSALGDVISALSSEQSFIPYRNNKLTLLMQDSLGGNAKTLMFVNISPANYNCDESIISLTYASRVKLITNSAQKNSDNKEIARLKDIINKLKKGEEVDEAVE